MLLLFHPQTPNAKTVRCVEGNRFFILRKNVQSDLLVGPNIPVHPVEQVRAYTLAAMSSFYVQLSHIVILAIVSEQAIGNRNAISVAR